MVLRVPLAEFAASVVEVLGTKRVYAVEQAGGTYLSAGCAGSASIVLSHVQRPLTSVKAELETAGLTVGPGQWSLDASAEMVTIPYVTAVAYQTGEAKPGLWIDACAESRAPGEVVQMLYDEFVASGDLEGLTFDAFVTAAQPTVIEIPPEAVAAFVRKNAS